MSNVKSTQNNQHSELYFFQSIIDLLAEPIFIKDNEHRITHANKAFYEIFQLEESQVIGYTLAEAVPENERKHFLSVDRKVLDTGVSDFQEEELTVAGETHTILTSKRRFTNDNGEHYLVGSIQNITELKKAEQELLEQKAKLEKALEEINTLKGIIPICSYCKSIRDDEGAWQGLENYISDHSEASFSHGICEDCLKTHFPEHSHTEK